MAATYPTATPAGAAGPIAVRTVTVADVRAALAEGVDDFMAMPSHVAFVALIYPILGLIFASLAFGYDVLPLVYPLISGFALVGPFAAIGLYELSRRRERGEPTRWKHAVEVLRSPSIGSLLAMGAVLVVVFLLWMATAQTIWGLTMGSTGPATPGALAADILGTGRGWALIILGNLAGFAFAVLVLAISVVAFPLILDRGVGVGTAVETSLAVAKANPVPMAAWGLIVAVVLALGSLPLFVGLAVALPILGHATWHLYRKAVA